MAEQTPEGNGEKTDFSERRQRQMNKKEGSERTRGRGRLPPQRGVLKKLRNEESEGAPKKRVPMTREEMQRQKAQAKGRTRRPSRGDFADPAAERARLERKLAVERAEEERLKQEQEQKQEQPAARVVDEAKLKEEEEKKKMAREEAEKRAEEIRIRREKEAAEKQAERERKRKEREEARLRAEEERKKKEKEEELKRLEEEKQRQEQERKRIFEKIEASKGKLSDEEREKALKIADEMVKRGIKWKGYISLSGGIGGSMLR